jgi:hypothetical protein
MYIYLCVYIYVIYIYVSMYIYMYVLPWVDGNPATGVELARKSSWNSANALYKP